MVRLAQFFLTHSVQVSHNNSNDQLKSFIIAGCEMDADSW